MARVSCILATKDRPTFLAQAIRYYQRQTHPDSELIVVDDSAVPHDRLVPPSPRITYVHLRTPATLGTKLNIGIERASGAIIQKLDDDDYYHPSFLTTTSATLTAAGDEDTVVSMGAFLVLLLAQWRFVNPGGGWFAGGSLCFHKAIWQRAPFRDVPRRVDVHFLEDHPTLVRRPVTDPELYVVVRHNRHTWTRIVPESVVPIADPGGVDVNAYFATCPAYHRSLRQVIGGENCRFYQQLALAHGASVRHVMSTARAAVRCG